MYWVTFSIFPYKSISIYINNARFGTIFRLLYVCRISRTLASNTWVGYSYVTRRSMLTRRSSFNFLFQNHHSKIIMATIWCKFKIDCYKRIIILYFSRSKTVNTFIFSFSNDFYYRSRIWKAFTTRTTCPGTTRIYPRRILHILLSKNWSDR